MRTQGITPVPIAFVLNSCHAGGTERQMIELLRRLNPARWLVHVACVHADGEWLPRVLEAAATVTEFRFSSFRHRDAMRQAMAFMRWCRAHDIAVVHTTNLCTNVFALPAAAYAGVPVRIANRREINPDKTRSQIMMQRAAYQFAHKVVANSRAAADRLRLERVPAGRVATVSNGIDSCAFAATRSRRPLRKIAVVANLRKEKGHDVLIDAAPEILRHFPDASVDIIGAGPELEALQSRARAQGVSSAFTFTGYEPDVARRLKEADLFVLPSRSEAFPNAILEAMSASLPIVASAVGGIVELIADGRTGLLVSPEDPHALAQGVCRLMSDRGLGARLGRTACQDVQGRYSFERMTSAFEDIYITELNRRGVALEHAHALAS
jgi:glycosyltransferase involved in cell wall biosynthesis